MFGRIGSRDRRGLDWGAVTHYKPKEVQESVEVVRAYKLGTIMFKWS
jgi:hypothetical protein